MILLPALAFALLWRRQWLRGQGPSLSLASSALGTGLLAFGLGEGLGAFQLLNAKALALGWGLGTAAAGTALALEKGRPLPMPALEKGEFWLLACASLPLLLALPLAVVSAPNNYDSLFYHLPRIVFWQQQSSLAHFPSAYPLQLSYPPLAETLLLHAHLLSGSDRFDNLLQWACLGGGAVLVHGITLRLGGSPRAAALATLLALTQPMALLQATSTQNDLVASFWLLALARFALEGSLGNAALAAGLALLCKGTSYFYAPPLLLLALFRRQRERPLGLGAALLCCLPALAPSIPHWERNLRTFGHPLGVAEDHVMASQRPSDLACGLWKNAALHLGATPSAALNQSVNAAALGLCRWGAADPEDACCNWQGSRLGQYGPASGWRAHDDYAGQPLHLGLILFSLGILGLAALSGKRAFGPGLAGAAVLGGLAYCALVVFNPWATRLHLPFFFLLFPLAGAWLAKKIRGLPLALVTALLLAYAARFALANETRPALGEASVFRQPRERQYFYSEAFAVQATRVMDFAQGRPWKDIGLFLGPFRLEYPFLRGLLAQDAGRRFSHLAPGNASARLSRGDFKADAVLRYYPGKAAPRLLNLGGRPFRKVFNAHFFAWYEALPAAP